MLTQSETLALSRSANVDAETARAWLEGLPTTPEISARLARIYRALRFGSPPPAPVQVAAISSRPVLT